MRGKVTLNAAGTARFLQWRRTHYSKAQHFAEIGQRYFAAREAGLVQTSPRPDRSVAALFRAGGVGFPWEVALVIASPTEPEHWMKLREAALDCLAASIRARKAKKRAERRHAALVSLDYARKWLERTKQVDSFMARGCVDAALVDVRDAISKLGASRG